ncbi:MAG TPA: ABC transporter permease [Verrucomicrobiota bacterium]|nr:ABC transporter permease [Verrucomicrobiota bacterium]
MALPLKYNVRNVFVRWRATLATVLGVALLVAVYILVQALAVGLEKNSANTGDPRNVMVVRKGSTSESSSLVSREHMRTLQYFPEIAVDEQRRPLLSADALTLVTLPRRAGGGEANVVIRGVSRKGLDLRPQVALVEGRWFTPGQREVVVSRRLAERFESFDVGDSFKAGPDYLKVVGWMDGQKSAFDSEAWMDADELRSLFDREDMYSSFLVRPLDEAARTSLIRRIEEDKRLQLRAFGEVEYYRSQTMTAAPIRWLGNFLASAMSIGAIFAAMNTMYAAVGARTREVGTLRVLGYRRRSVVVGFLIEGACLALIGGAMGCLLSLPMNGYATATIGFETFSETVFEFRITPWLMLKGMLFALIVGVMGSLLPAIRASRLPVIMALKAV